MNFFVSFVLKYESNTEDAKCFSKSTKVVDQGLFSELTMGRIARLIFIALIALLGISSSAGYFYWRSLKQTPQYSVALLIDAARRDDKSAVNNLVDTNAVVDD